MRTIIDATRLEECIDRYKQNHYGNLNDKNIQYRQGYKKACKDILYDIHSFLLESEYVDTAYTVDIRDIRKKFDDAAKNEDLAPIIRLAIGAAKEIVLNDRIINPEGVNEYYEN